MCISITGLNELLGWNSTSSITFLPPPTKSAHHRALLVRGGTRPQAAPLHGPLPMLGIAPEEVHGWRGHRGGREQSWRSANRDGPPEAVQPSSSMMRGVEDAHDSDPVFGRRCRATPRARSVWSMTRRTTIQEIVMETPRDEHNNSPPWRNMVPALPSDVSYSDLPSAPPVPTSPTLSARAFSTPGLTTHTRHRNAASSAPRSRRRRPTCSGGRRCPRRPGRTGRRLPLCCQRDPAGGRTGRR
jgi:hypothetical protein